MKKFNELFERLMSEGKNKESFIRGAEEFFDHPARDMSPMFMDQNDESDADFAEEGVVRFASWGGLSSQGVEAREKEDGKVWVWAGGNELVGPDDEEITFDVDAIFDSWQDAIETLNALGWDYDPALDWKKE